MRKTTAKLLTLALLLSATAASRSRSRRARSGRSKRKSDRFSSDSPKLDRRSEDSSHSDFRCCGNSQRSFARDAGTQRTALNDAAKSNAADVSIDQLAATLGATSGQLAAIQTKAFAKFYALLTTEQRTKLDELHANGRGMRGPGADLSIGPGVP